METNEETVNGVDLLMEVLGSEYSLYSNSEDEDKQKAFKNFMDSSRLLLEIQKAQNEFELNDSKNQIEVSENEIRNKFEEARLEIERQKINLDNERLIFEKIQESNKKSDSKWRTVLDVAGLTLEFVGIIASIAVTMKTLDVNLDSVMTDRDAVASGRKLFDHFALKKRR